MKRHFYFIINQNSRDYKKSVEQLGYLLPKYTPHYDLFITESLDQSYNLLSQLKRSLWPTDVIVAVGGDGSLHYLINHVKQLDINNPISFIPSGSGNDFARSNGIPLDLSKAIRHLFHGRQVVDLDLLQVRTADDIFLAVNSIGYGLDGDIIHELTQKSENKRKFGGSSYFRSILSAFTHLKPFTVQIQTDSELESHTYQDVQLLLIANQPYFGGGIKIFPTANAKDQKLDILIASQVKLHHLIKILWLILSGRPFLGHPKFKCLSAQSVDITVMNPQYAQRDGESFLKYGEPLSIGLVTHPFYL